MTKLAVITGRKEHAARINEAWQKGVDAVIETGMRIIDAREGLEHAPNGLVGVLSGANRGMAMVRV